MARFSSMGPSTTRGRAALVAAAAALLSQLGAAQDVDSYSNDDGGDATSSAFSFSSR